MAFICCETEQIVESDWGVCRCNTSTEGWGGVAGDQGQEDQPRHMQRIIVISHDH